MFKNRESGVKPPSLRQFVPQRIQLTPCPPDVLHKEKVSGSFLTEKQTGLYGDTNSGINGGNVGHGIRSILSNTERDVSSKSGIVKSAQAIAPMMLNFDISPLKSGQRNCNSVDMFDDMSSISRQKGIEPNLKMQPYHKNGGAGAGAITHDEHNNIETATDIEQNLNQLNGVIENTKEPRLDFKEPLGMGPPTLIQIKKGGKNWRRSIMICPSKSVPSDVIKNRNTTELKTLARKSSIIMEHKKRSTFGIVNYGTAIPEIAEISIMEKSHVETEYETEKISKNVCDHVEYDGVVPEKAPSPLHTSYTVAKSSSYIVPSDEHNASRLCDPNIDILAKVLSKCTEKEIWRIKCYKRNNEAVLILYFDYNLYFVMKNKYRNLDE